MKRTKTRKPAEHHDRLIAELRAGREFAAKHLNSAAEKDDPQAYVAALKDLVESIGMTRIAKATKLAVNTCRGRFHRRESFAFPHILRL